MPISALVFGGRLSHSFPLVYEARDWNPRGLQRCDHGSEATAAARPDQAAVRRDPMAMLPFCGYNMADYWRHWLALGGTAGHGAENLPRELVPQGRRGALPCGRVSARTCGCSNG